jgi:hypothetical protein
VRVLKVGDKFALPGKDEMVIGKEDVNDEQMVVVLEGSPIPTRLYKGKGYWRVDPSPLIAVRKAGEKALEGQKEKVKQQLEKQQEKEIPATK